jgi:hypothetical protein
MAERSVLDLTLRTKKSGQGAQQATSELQQFNREVAKAKELAKTFALGMAATVAAVVGFGLAAKKAFEFGKAGAELEEVERKFQRLSAEMGLSSTFMERIQRATGGVASEFELAGSAMNLMSLGLVKSESQLRRLVRVSGELGFDMNQLVLTMANMTTMRFDALGVSVDGFKERVAALRAEGLSAADAFREAFLAQAEDQLKRVGSVADTTLGAFKRLEAQFKNISDATKEWASKALGPLVLLFAESAEATETLRTAVEMAIITEEEYDRLHMQRRLSTLSNIEIQEIYGTAIEAIAAREEAAAEATAEWTRRLEAQAEQLAAISQIQPTLAVKMELETENVFDKVREQLGMLERGAGELALVAEILPEVDWGLVDPALRDMILGQGEALSMLVSADIEGMTPEQQEKLRAQIAEATDIPPEHVDILWRNFQERGESAVQEWVTSTLGLLRGTVSPEMQAAVDPLISGVGRFTRSLDALDGRRIKIYVDYIRRGSPPAAAPGGQHGLHFLVGGLPGPDRNLVTLRLTRGEEVSVKPRSGSPQAGMATGSTGGGNTINFYNTIGSELDGMAFIEKAREAFARL